MIDIIQQVQAANPALGSKIIVLRADSRALSAPDRLSAKAQAWLAEKAPGAKVSRETVLLAPYPGAEPHARAVTVLAFEESQHLAAFAGVWTGDVPAGDET